MEEENQNPITPQEFAKKIKEKYPQYANIDDVTLAKKMVEKYPEYSTQVNFVEKKNQNGTVITPKKSGELVPKDGSLGISAQNKPFEVKDQFKPIPKKQTKEPSKYKEGSLSWNLEKLKESTPEIEQSFSEYEKAKIVPKEKVSAVTQEVMDKYHNKGFANGLKTGIYKSINYILNPVTDVIETDEFADERKSVAKKIKEEREQYIANKKQPPVYTQTNIDNMIINRKVKKLVDSQRDSQVRSFLEDSEASYTKDVSGKSKRERLNIYQNLDLGSLSEKSRENLKQQDIVLPALATSMESLKEYKKKIDNKTPLSADEITDVQSKLENLKKLEQNAIELKQDYFSTQGKIKNSKEALDLFSRDYSFARHFKNLESGIKDIAGGVAGAVDYGIEVSGYATEKLGLPNVADIGAPVRNIARGISEDLLAESKEIKKGVSKPIAVDDINSWDDLGSWLGDLASTQAPIFALVATGVPGIAALGISATGQKYEGMLEEMKPEPGKMAKQYSTEQLISIPAIFGASETASAVVDFYLLKGASKAYNSATVAERSMVVDGIANKIFKTGGGLIKTGGIEAIDEGATQITQNFADIYIGGDSSKSMTDGLKDAMVAGAVMGTFISFAPMAVAKATSKYSLDNKVQKTANQIMALQAQLDSNELSVESRKIIQEQLAGHNKELNTLLEKRVGDMESLSNEQFQEINKIEKTQANIKQKALDVKSDPSIQNDVKKQLLSNLEQEFRATDQRRIDLLKKGASVQIERLPEKEQKRLKEKAQKELIKERNPDGTANITIEDDEIAKRAVQLHNKEVAERKAKEALDEKPKNIFYYKGDVAPTEIPEGYTTTKKVENSAEVKLFEEQEAKAKETEIEQLRADEQAELKKALPNAELKADGKIDVEKLSLTDAVTYDDIYSKYDKLITPLLEESKKPTKSEPITEENVVDKKPEIIDLASKINNNEIVHKNVSDKFKDLQKLHKVLDLKGGERVKGDNRSNVLNAREKLLSENKGVKYIYDNFDKILEEMGAKKGDC